MVIDYVQVDNSLNVSNKEKLMQIGIWFSSKRG